MSGPEVVRVSSVVEVEPAEAFRLFTEEVDLWWRRGPRFRAADDRRLALEPGVGGRLVAYAESGSVFEIGRIRVWDPPARLVFAWRARSFEGDQGTEVEVRFENAPRGTRVTLEHRGWEAVPAGHPVRHGLAGPAFVVMMGHWWADLLHAMRAHAGGSGGARPCTQP